METAAASNDGKYRKSEACSDEKDEGQTTMCAKKIPR